MKYYSEILEKTFDTEKELVKAEKEHAEAEAKKAEAKALVKKESEVVNDAFVARNAARKVYNEKVLEARKAYNEKVKAAQEEFNKSIEEASEAKTIAEKDFDAKLSEFNKAHPEGFRLTLKDGDNVVTYYNQEVKYNTNWYDEFDKLFDSLRKLW